MVSAAVSAPASLSPAALDSHPSSCFVGEFSVNRQVDLDWCSGTLLRADCTTYDHTTDTACSSREMCEAQCLREDDCNYVVFVYNDPGPNHSRCARFASCTYFAVWMASATR